MIKCVVGHSGDDRTIDVTVKVRNDHLLPNAWDGHHAEAAAVPALRYPYPTRGFFIRRIVAIPMKMHANAAIFIHVDLFTGWPHHGGHFVAVGGGFIAIGGTPISFPRNEAKMICQRGSLMMLAVILLKRFRHFSMMFNGDDLPFVVHGGNGVFGERKDLARHQGGTVRLTSSCAAVGLQLFNTIFG